MKTPDEIKKGLEICIGHSDLSEDYCEKCPYIPDASCRDTLEIDALALIRQLEESKERLEQNLSDEYRKAVQRLERERDAAVTDLAENRRCETCKYYTPGYFCIGCRRGDQWEWRGVQKVD